MRSIGREDNIVDFGSRTRQLNGGNGGGGIDERLRAVENSIARIETKLDTELKHVATRAWVLAGVVGGMGLAATVALTILKLFGE